MKTRVRLRAQNQQLAKAQGSQLGRSNSSFLFIPNGSHFPKPICNSNHYIYTLASFYCHSAVPLSLVYLWIQALSRFVATEAGHHSFLIINLRNYSPSHLSPIKLQYHALLISHESSFTNIV